MHFTTLFVLKNVKLKDVSLKKVEELFCNRFCYCCGETTPKYQMWCDWFQTGGRWGDIIKAKKGIHCKSSWSNNYAKPQNGIFSIVQISDLTEPLPRQHIYSVATKSKIILKNDEWTDGIIDEEKFNQMLDDIDNKKFDGVIALFDCHD